MKQCPECGGTEFISRYEKRETVRVKTGADGSPEIIIGSGIDLTYGWRSLFYCANLDCNENFLFWDSIPEKEKK